MITPLIAFFLAALQAAVPTVENKLMAALAAGDASAVEALLAADVTIMHDQTGRPEPATGAAIAAFLRGCEGRIQFDTPGDEPGAMAFNLMWSCGARGEAEMLLWTANGRVVWIQLFLLAPRAEEQASDPA